MYHASLSNNYNMHGLNYVLYLYKLLDLLYCMLTACSYHQYFIGQQGSNVAICVKKPVYNGLECVAKFTNYYIKTTLYFYSMAENIVTNTATVLIRSLWSNGSSQLHAIQLQQPLQIITAIVCKQLTATFPLYSNHTVVIWNHLLGSFLTWKDTISWSIQC